MKVKITLKQANDLYNAITNLKSGGVYVKGSKNIDLAINKKNLEPIIDGYKIASETPENYVKYINQLKDLELKYESNRIGMFKEYTELKEKHSKDIEEYNDWIKNIKELPKEEKEVDLIMLKKSDVCFTDENNGLAQEIVFGLLPILQD